jgi:glycosyltransferase involved in cell wall biosynthesis
MKKTFFSIVIPTLNEEKYLPLLLEDLSNQTFSKDSFEIIHVDAESKDKTVAVAKKFADRLNIKTITSDKKNVSWQRNIGGELASSKWVIFMDADNRLPKYFLDGLKYQLAKSPTTDIFTTWLAVIKPTSLEGSIARVLNLALEVYSATGKPSAFGAMIGVKKSIFEKIKFDSSQKFMEDALFVNQVCKTGAKFKIFQEPRYVFSMRRFEKEGTLKFVGNSALLQLKYIQGKDFKDEERYKMLGGTYYDQISPTLFKTLISQIKKAPAKQIELTKKILDRINAQLDNLS